MANITLISPPEQHLLMEAGDRPPMGLLYLAANLRYHGHEPIISDLNHDSYRQLAVKLEGADHIGITTSTPYYEWFTNFAKHLKQNYPDKSLIAGGPHATVDPDSLPMFDYVVVGEGERALVDIVNGETERIVQRPYIKKLDLLPSPHPEMDEKVYGLNQEGHRTATILSSRSCPFTCFFCTKDILGKTQRKHSVARTMWEIHELKDKGYDSFYFLDDCFTADNQRVSELADDIIADELDISFRFGTRTDKVNEGLLGKLQEAGLRSISFGLEHFDDYVLKKTRKVNTTETHIKAIRMAKGLGLKVRGSFIVNLPGATSESAYKTLYQAMDEDIDFADFYPLIAYPGTPLWEDPNKWQCEIVDKSYGGYQTGTKTNVRTRNLEPEDTTHLVKDLRSKWAEHKGLDCPWEAHRD